MNQGGPNDPNQSYQKTEKFNEDKMNEELEDLMNKDIYADMGDFGKPRSEYIDQLSDHERKRREFIDQFETHGHDYDPKRQSKEFHETKQNYKEMSKASREYNQKYQGKGRW